MIVGFCLLKKPSCCSICFRVEAGVQVSPPPLQLPSSRVFFTSDQCFLHSDYTLRLIVDDVLPGHFAGVALDLASQ
jgi:hypothetical protein